MPKMKTNSAAKKRFKRVGKDKIKQLTIRINALLPSSNFGNDDIEDWIFDGGGGATAGFGAGLQYLIPLENPSFGVFLSGDRFINNTKNKITEDWEDIFASKQNVKYPKYINIPILAGFNYNYKKENSSIGFFGNTGLGFNYLKITNFSTSIPPFGIFIANNWSKDLFILLVVIPFFFNALHFFPYPYNSNFVSLLGLHNLKSFSKK